MKKFKFYGADSGLTCETDDGDKLIAQPIGQASMFLIQDDHSLQVDGFYVVGSQLTCINDKTWSIGIAMLPHVHHLPNWIVRFEPSRNIFSPELIILARDSVLVMAQNYSARSDHLVC